MRETLNIYDSLNKLFLSFTTSEQLDETLKEITRRYSILYNKIFVLESPQTTEYICTYNIDTGNVSDGLMPNTILVHRKKSYNCLYSVNGLNALIKLLNNNKLDKNFIVPWENYQNNVVLSSGHNLRILETSIHKIININ